MSIGHLLDHECVVWRPTETRGTYAETVRGYSILHALISCAVLRKNAVIAQAGPGRIDAGERRVYWDVGPTVEKKDLIELVTGPDAPAFLEVESMTTPRGHHVEVRVSEYNGDAPEVGS